MKLSNKSFQPFRFVEHPALQDFITFLNHKIKDDDIPHKSSIANAVNGKVLQLESLCSTLLRYVAHASICAGPYLPINKAIPSKVSTIWDGWSTRKW